MSEYREKRTVIEEAPFASRPVVETQYDSVVRERPAMSGGAIAALVLAAIAAAVVITMLILNNQNHQTEDALAQERARAAAAEQTPSQQPQQQQPVIVVPQSQPTTVQVPVPVPSQPEAAQTAPSSASIEMDITSKLLNDPDLRSPSVDVKVSVLAGTVTLRGHVPTEELKIRAARLARTANGVRNVVNELVVEP